MWNILGKDALYVELGEVWKQRVIELADDERKEKFKELMEPNEILYMMNGTTEEHTFFVKLPKDMTPEDIQFMADVTLDVAKAYEQPYLTIENTEQRYKIIFTNVDEPELLGINKTEGFSSGAIFMPILESITGPGRMNDSLL